MSAKPVKFTRTADQGDFKLYVVWGESVDEDSAVTEYSFVTEEERIAFTYGVDEANGWMDVYYDTDREAVEQYLRDELGEYDDD